MRTMGLVIQRKEDKRYCLTQYSIALVGALEDLKDRLDRVNADQLFTISANREEPSSTVTAPVD